jgi:hypothetical protein
MIAQRTFNQVACGLSALALLLAGCAQTPMGPTVQVMPGPGKTFEVFQVDQTTCKGVAQDAVKGQADAANQQAVGAAVLTTAIGAGLGAAVGSTGGAAGTGAAVGAGAGSVAGAGIGAQNSSMAQLSIQQQYDNAFAQCMYAKGDQVPGYTPIAAAQAPRAMPAPDPLVRATQVELIRLQYLNGAADGAMGPMTSGAIRSFEQASGLPVNGTVSPRLLARLQSTPTGSGAAAAAAPPTTATAPPAGWVQPTTTAQPATPASAPSGWVQPKTQSP